MPPSPYKLIIGISGKIGSGKNYILEKIIFERLRKHNKNVSILAFGDALKISCFINDNIPYEKLFYDKDTATRKTLQIRGMEGRKIDDSVFVKSLDCSMRIAFDRGVDIVLISDVRMKNEFQFLKERGAILIRVNAPNRTRDKIFKECSGNESAIEEITNHISETSLDDLEVPTEVFNGDRSFLGFDHIFNNDYEFEKIIGGHIEFVVDKAIENYEIRSAISEKLRSPTDK